MGYVAVSGGKQAIDASLELLELERLAEGRSLETQLVLDTLPELVEQVEGEGSLWAPDVAAIAVKQARGSVEEAVFLVRAYRSTLERLYTSRVIDTSAMQVNRRISAAFKDVPGGQVLGATRDYSHRLIDFDLADETPDDVRQALANLRATLPSEPVVREDGSLELFDDVPKVCDYLRSIKILASYPVDDTQPIDITKTPMSFPCPRSGILQCLTRGMTQAVIAIGYAAIRGFGLSHPTIGELRRGEMPVCIDGPAAALAGETPDPEDAYYLGSIPCCEVESLIVHDTEEHGVHRSDLDMGYGLVFGGDESKAIAMSVLDHSLRQDDVRFPTQDQEFVLLHIEGVEATGFISHLKLPHYVTFQSKLDSARRSAKIAAEREQEAAAGVQQTVGAEIAQTEAAPAEGDAARAQDATAGAEPAQTSTCAEGGASHEA